jgi:hypothetical protein
MTSSSAEALFPNGKVDRLRTSSAGTCRAGREARLYLVHRSLGVRLIRRCLEMREVGECTDAQRSPSRTSEALVDAVAILVFESSNPRPDTQHALLMASRNLDMGRDGLVEVGELRSVLGVGPMSRLSLDVTVWLVNRNTSRRHPLTCDRILTLTYNFDDIYCIR